MRPGGLPVARAPTLRRAGPTGGVRLGRVPVTSGSGGAFARTLAVLADASHDMADRAAEREATAAGVEAGRQDGFKPDDSDTIRGRAFNRAGLETFMARLDQKVRTSVDAVVREHRGRPAELTAALDQVRQELTADLPSAAVPGAEGLISRLGSVAIREARDAREAQVLDNRRGAVVADLAARRSSISTAAARGADPGADQVIDTELEQLRQFLIGHGPKEAFVIGDEEIAADPARSGVFTAAQISGRLAETEGLVREERILATFQKLPAGRRAAYLQQFEQGFLDGNNPLEIDGEQFQQLRTRMLVQINRDSSGRSAAVRSAAKQVNEVGDLVRDGYTVQPELIAAVRDQVAATGDEALAGELARVEGLIRFTDQVRQLDPVTLQTAVNGMRAAVKDGATPEIAERIDLAEDLLDTMRTELGRDPLSYAQRVGVAEVRPIRFGDPDQLLGDLQARRGAALEVAQHYGTGLQIFTDEEAGVLAEQLSTAGVDDRFRILGALRAGLGEDTARALEQLAPKQPALAHVGGLIALGPAVAGQTVRDALVGLQLIRDGEGRVGRDIGAKAATVDLLHGSLPPGAGRTRAALVETARGIYTARAVRAGVPSDETDDELWEQSLQAAAGRVVGANGEDMGGIVEFRSGNRVIVPPIVTPDRFREVFDLATVEDLAAASVNGEAPRHGDGTAATAEDVRDSYLVTAGSGQYRVSFRADPAEGERPLMAGAEPYVIDLVTLLKRVGRQQTERVRTREEQDVEIIKQQRERYDKPLGSGNTIVRPGLTGREGDE